jgi:hypothetical protein
MRFLLPVLALCTLSSVPLRADLVTVPNALTNVEGNGNNNFPFDSISPMRYQQVFAASQFPSGGGLITQIAFRPDGLVGIPFDVTINNIQIDLSTTLVAPDALSNVFAANVGPNDAVVYSGALSLSSADTGPPGGPKAFDIIINLQTPFFYVPALGNLLLDVRNNSGLPSGAAGGFDSENLVGDSVSRVLGNIGSATASINDTEGLATQFTFAAQTPEPGSLSLLAIAVGLVLVRTRPRFQK